MVMDKPVYLPAEGKAALEERLNHLKAVRRPEVADRIQQAKLDGDISVAPALGDGLIFVSADRIYALGS